MGPEWTQSQLARLQELWSASIRIKDIADALSVPPDRVKRKAKRLGLPRRSTNAQWSPEETEKAVAMWVDGYSARQIENALGTKTRNAVIGRMARLGVQSSQVKRPREYGPRKARVYTARAPRAPRPPRQRATKAVVALWQPELLFKPQAALPPKSLNLSIMELQREIIECRWIEGEPNSGACGHVVVRGRSYCPFHEAKAYLPRTQTNSTRSSSAVLENIKGREAA